MALLNGTAICQNRLRAHLHGSSDREHHHRGADGFGGHLYPLRNLAAVLGLISRET